MHFALLVKKLKLVTLSTGKSSVDIPENDRQLRKTFIFIIKSKIIKNKKLYIFD